MSELADRIRSHIHDEPGLTQKALALAVGMKPDALSRALSGDRGFSIDELFAIAAHCKTSVHELVTGEADPFATAVAARHGFDTETRSYKQPAWDTSRPVLDDVALAYRQAGASARSNGPRALSRSARDMRSVLTTVHGPRFVTRFADAIEQAVDIDVIRLDGLSESYSLRIGERVVIVTGDTANWFYQNWSLAHELGHIVSGSMHEIDQTGSIVSAEENAANRFAADLLMPAEVVRAVHWDRADLETLASFLWDAGVSTRALAIRLRSLGVSVSPEVTRALEQPTQRLLARATLVPGISSAELVASRAQASSARRFPTHLIAAHRLLVESGALHAKTLAWMLGTDESDIEQDLNVAGPDLSDEELQTFLGLGD